MKGEAIVTEEALTVGRWDRRIHISEMSEKFVKNPSEIVSIGDVVKVKVLDIDQEKQKLKLTK